MAIAGPRNKVGPPGEPGKTPSHEWDGPRLRFENSDGSWGEWENLKGPKGAKGEKGDPGKDGASGWNGRPGIGVPDGGETGQVLAKVSAEDYDTEWVDPGAGGPATQAPKLIVTFDTDSGTSVGDLVYLTATDFVSTVTDNLPATIPNGIFGVCTAKPTSITAQVLFVGVQSGYSGLTPGAPLFVQTDGTVGHSIPASDVIQQIGFAISSTEMFLLMQTPYIIN